MKTRVEIPINLTVSSPLALMGPALEEIEKRLVEEAARVWLTAQRELQADGIDHVPRAAAASFEWIGTGRRAFTELERRAIEKRVRAVIDRATTVVLAPKPRPPEDWKIEEFEFRVRFDKFLALLVDVNTAWAHDLEARYAGHLEDDVNGVVWVAQTLKGVAFGTLVAELNRRRAKEFGRYSPFFYIWDAQRTELVRALDRANLRGLPRLRDKDAPSLPDDDQLFVATGEVAPEDTRNWILPPGTRLIYVGVALPKVSNEPLVDFEQGLSVPVPLSSLLQRMVDGAKVAEKYKFSAGTWPPFMELSSAWPVPVRILPFSLRRAAHADTLERVVWPKAEDDVWKLNRSREEHDAAWTFGTMQLLGPSWLGSIPDELRAALRKFPALSTSTAGFGDEWQAGWRGVYVSPLFSHMVERVYVANHVDDLRREGDELARILDLSDGPLTAHRFDALESFLQNWKGDRGAIFMEVIFAQLDKRHAFAKLFEVLRDHYALYFWMREAVARNVAGTSYKDRPEVRAFVDWQYGLSLEYRDQITFDPATGELVFVHGGLRVRPAGDSNDPNAGVIAEVEPYFSEKAKVMRPTKATMDRLKAPTQKKVGDLMVAMMCQGRETRTREDLIQEAVQAAASELKLTDKDFEEARIRLSYRVMKIQRRPQNGFYVIVVTVVPVRKFSDGPWEEAGQAKEVQLNELDGMMMSIHVAHEVAAMNTFFLAEMVVLGGIFVIAEGIGGVIALTIAVTIRELIYIHGTSAEDRDLDGYLTAALYGVVDVIGFNLGKLAADQVGRRIAGNLIRREVLARTTSKWIIYIGKGLASSAVFGATQVVEKFGDDLFHLTQCRQRWSSPWEYFEEFGKGFAMGLAFEFVLAPVLSVGGRGLVRALTSSKASEKDLGALLRKYMRPDEAEELAEQGAKKLEQALQNTFKPEKADFLARFMEALRKNIKDVVEHAKMLEEPKGLRAKVRAEWTSRATAELFESAQIPLGKNALTTVEVLVRSTSREEMNALVETLLSSPRLRTFLEASPKLATELLTRGFRGGAEELDQFLGRLGRLSSTDATRVLDAVARLGFSDTADAVTASGKTIEVLLELVGQKAEAAELLGRYSKQIVGKKFTALTKQDFANSLTRQKQIYSDALRFQARQQALADEVMAGVGRQRGTAKSILKRDDLAEFVDGVVGKMTRNKYSMVAEMNDMVRGRFDMADEEAVLSVTEALQTQRAFKLHPDAKGRTYEAPRLSASGKVRYPRYHFVLEDESGMTHEWQVGTKAATTLYEKRGIKIPSELTDAATKLGRKFNPDLHDIEYDLFQGINKQYPQIAARNGLPAFIEEVVDASDRAAAGDAFVELNETIVRLQERASRLLKQLVDNQGAEWVAQFFH